jgi:hypothetical protein
MSEPEFPDCAGLESAATLRSLAAYLRERAKWWHAMLSRTAITPTVSARAGECERLADNFVIEAVRLESEKPTAREPMPEAFDGQ